MIILILIITFIIIIKILQFRSPGEIGSAGEHKVNHCLRSLGPEYLLLNDILIQNSDGSTSQIDHLVISEYGLFVIETKNYTGWIFGNEKAEKWKQVIYNDTYYFRNPIKQNWSHIYALKAILKDYHKIHYYPIVVFSGDAELMNINSSVPVIYKNSLKDLIEYYSTEKCLSTSEVQQIKNNLKSFGQVKKELKERHVQTIKKKIQEKELKKANLICPKCNGQLILREGKYGQFYGCSNYPNCKFTMKY